MKTGRVACQSGVNVQTLRYYQRRGLRQAPSRRPSGYREYASDVVRVVRFAKRTQDLGFSLDQVESFLELAASRPPNCDQARVLATQKLVEMDGKILRLRAMQNSLTRMVETCEKPRPHRECPLLDALAERARSAHHG